MTTATSATEIPLVDYLALGDEPHLVAQECTACGALYFDRRNGCGRCGGSDFGPRPLAPTGTVRTFTVIHRAAPKVKTPFVSAIIDLDGGGVVKSNLLDVDPDGAAIPVAMPVELTVFPAGQDDDGTTAMAFGFRPRKEES